MLAFKKIKWVVSQSWCIFTRQSQKQACLGTTSSLPVVYMWCTFLIFWIWRFKGVKFYLPWIWDFAHEYGGLSHYYLLQWQGMILQFLLIWKHWFWFWFLVAIFEVTSTLGIIGNCRQKPGGQLYSNVFIILFVLFRVTDCNFANISGLAPIKMLQLP